MNFETVTLGIAMIIIAMAEIGFSLSLSIRNGSTFNMVLSSLILILNGISIFVLMVTLNVGWPNYAPHFAVSISTVLAIIQIRGGRQHKKMPRSS